MKKQILLLCLALTSLCSYAQTITVKGVVTSASDKEPMIGATVQVKGTGTGTITSIDGDYSLNDVAKDAVLVFSSIGYETQEIKVNGQTVINVVLKDASELLDEVVVIGYGAVKKSDLMRDIQSGTLSEEELTVGRQAVISSLCTMLDSHGRMEDFWFTQAVAEATNTPEEWMEQVRAVTKEQVVSAAQNIQLDTIYYLTGKEA